jgi:hypothetical protein
MTTDVEKTMNTDGASHSETDSTPVKSNKKTVKSSTLERLLGITSDLHKIFKPSLPAEIVAGSLPHIAGSEEESVWNAAVQACGTERVHFTYTIEDGKCWYLATPSSTLASDPDSWCPLAAALPGNSEYWDRETVYIYEKDGQAGALRWDAESDRMQIYLGASRTILPKVQSMDTNFVTINDTVADVAPWLNMNLRTDALTRTTAKILTLVGACVAVIAGAYIIGMYAYANMIQPQLDQTKSDTELAAMQLLSDASRSLENDTIKHIIRIQELLDTLLQIQGTLVKYEVKADVVSWEALVPRSFASNDNPLLRGARLVTNKIESDGRVRIKGTQ